MSSEEITPFMRQYLVLKREIPQGAILLVRLGDYYETFGEDAIVASPLMGTALTQRNGKLMTNFPYYHVCSYLAKLVRAGKTVALADVVEKNGRGKMARREIVRVITPGTAGEEV